MNRLTGPVFRLGTCVGTLGTCLGTLFLTKLPLIVPVTSGVAALVIGVMVVHDVKPVWLPMLTKKPGATP